MAGELITQDFELEIQGLLTGCGTDYDFGPNVISGLGTPPPKTRDFQLQGQSGSLGGGDYRDIRILLVDYLICAPDDPEEAISRLRTLAQAWEPVSDPNGVELHFQLPGFRRFVTGFPRGLDYEETDRLYQHGVVTGIAEFHCMVSGFFVP
jgi:hypothetical protein